MEDREKELTDFACRYIFYSVMFFISLFTDSINMKLIFSVLLIQGTINMAVYALKDYIDEKFIERK